MLTIANNFVAHNAGGGVRVNTTTKDNEVALYANITNNVIIHNTHGEALQLEGKYSLPFIVSSALFSLQCFDAVGWVAAGASSPPLWVGDQPPHI